MRKGTVLRPTSTATTGTGGGPLAAFFSAARGSLSPQPATLASKASTSIPGAARNGLPPGGALVALSGAVLRFVMSSNFQGAANENIPAALTGAIVKSRLVDGNRL